MAASTGCLTEFELGQLAEGGTASPQLQQHLDQCEACRARLEAASDEASFLSRVRTLSTPGLAPSGAPRITGYRVLEMVSGGSQGVIYRAIQESTQRVVAIKTLPPGEAISSRQLLRAEREAEIAARLRHPNIVTVYESRTLGDGRTAVIMEFIDGVPLDRWMPASDSTAEMHRDILRIFVDVCNGIHHAHLNGVIHRDLKPDNILVTAERRPVILDFGIARATGLRTTRTGDFAGTPAFASPEQVSRRPDEVDALTDVYSLGVILYKVLCHALPYELSGSIFEIARTIENTEPILPRVHNPSIHADLEAVLSRALAKDKRKRYQSAASLGRDIERFLAGAPVEARSASGWYLLRKAILINRRRLAFASIGGAVFLAAIGAAWTGRASATRAGELADLRAAQARSQEIHAQAVTELLREALPNSDPEHPELAGLIGAGLGRLYFRLETGAFSDDPEVDQEVRRLWSHVYTGFGGGKAATLVEYAEVSLRLGLERLRCQVPPDNASIAASEQALAGLLLVRLRAKEAEEYALAALGRWEQSPTIHARRIVECRALLARVAEARGDDDAALLAADAADAAITTASLPEPNLVAAAMSSLRARIAMRRNDASTAEPLLREALVARFRLLPPEDPELLSTLDEIATLAIADPSRELVRIAARAWDSGPGSLADRIRRDIRKLGTTSSGLWGDRFQAQSGRTDAFSRVLSLHVAVVGPNDPSLVSTLLARFRASAGEDDLDARVESALKAADILASHSPSSSAGVLMCMEEAAVALSLAGRMDHAIDLSRRAKRMRAEVPVEARDMLLYGTTVRRLGWYLSLANRFEEAESELQEARACFIDVVGPNHHLIAIVDSNLAMCQLGRGNMAVADDLSRAALELSFTLPATPRDQRANLQFVRASVLTAIARAEADPARARALAGEAAGLFDAAWLIGFVTFRPSFPWRASFARDATTCWTILGDPDRAAVWAARGLEGPPLSPNLPGVP